MSSPKISIVIPSFNKVKYIGRTLESIFNQKYPALEVIVQDGGSTDGTVDVIKRYVARHPRQIRFESKKDRGQLDAINEGMKKTTGNVVAFINADDAYVDGTFSEIGKAYVSNPGALWFTGRGIVINKNGKEIAQLASLYKNFLLSLDSRKCLLITNYLMQPSTFLTRTAYERFGPFGGTRYFLMEYDLWLRLSKIQMPVVVSKVLSKFRIEPTTKSKKMTREILLTDEKIVRKYTKNPIILLLHYINNFGRIVTGRFV